MSAYHIGEIKCMNVQGKVFLKFQLFQTGPVSTDEIYGILWFTILQKVTHRLHELSQICQGPVIAVINSPAVI